MGIFGGADTTDMLDASKAIANVMKVERISDRLFFETFISLGNLTVFVPPKIPNEAYQELLNVHSFNFGGGGLSGSTTTGEKNFKTILASTNGLQLFKSALTSGTTEAKMYALCGIHKLAPNEFNVAAAPMVSSKQSVNLIDGCLVSSENTSNVVQRIKQGSYDVFLISVTPSK